MARARSKSSPKSNPKETAAGCGCLLAILVVLGAIGNACSGGDDERPASSFSPLLSTTAPARPTTPLWAPPTTTSPAPTTTRATTTTARPAPAPDPDPDPDTRRRTQAPEPARDKDDDEDDGKSSSKGESGGSVYYPNCAAVQAAGKAPIRRGDPGYARHLDRDGDGEGCAGD